MNRGQKERRKLQYSNAKEIAERVEARKTKLWKVQKETTKNLSEKAQVSIDSNCKKTYVCNPENLDLSFLPEKLRDYGRLFIDMIIRNLARNKDKEYVPLKSHVIQQQIHNRDFYKLRKALVDNHIIDINHSYTVGCESKGYKLLEPYASSSLVRIALTNRKVIKKVIRNKERFPITIKNPVQKSLFSTLQKVVINESEARKVIALYNGRSKTNREYGLMRLMHGEYYFHEDLQGRIYNNVVNMAKDLREHLSLDNKKLIQIDIVNSQPTFFSIHLLKTLLNSQPILANNIGGGGVEGEEGGIGLNRIYEYMLQSRSALPHDIQDFIKLCEEGSIYECILDAYCKHYPNSKAKRKRFKIRFISEVLYCKNDVKQSRIRKLFVDLFPNVQMAISKEKATDYKKLALMMQRDEADFVINHVCKTLIEKNPAIPILSIHDALLTTPEYKDDVLLTLANEFAKRNIMPSVKVGEEKVGDGKKWLKDYLEKARV